MTRLSVCIALAMVWGGSLAFEMTADQAYQTIRDSFSNTDDYLSSYSTCTMGSDESCPMASMPNDETTVVYPGGSTRCIFNSDLSGDFGFQVVPGNRSKLLFYFQGGGACWDKLSTELGLCKTSVDPASMVGVLDRDRDDNPFKDYTVVQVLYCSGDVHGGNVTRDYNDKDGEPVQQTGYANVLATINWVLDQPDMQAVEDLVVMGCSAGSLGAQVWSSTLLEYLQPIGYKRASVFPDSFVGIFSENVEGPLIRDFGYCSTPLIDDDLKQECYDGELVFAEIMDQELETASNVPYAWLNSKEDIVQISYYVAVAATMYPNTTLFIDPSIYYQDVNERFEYYYGSHANAVLYLVQSAQHCYTPLQYMYEADAASKKGGGYSPTVIDYMTAMRDGLEINGECDGDVVDLADKPDKWTSYCDKALDGRVVNP